MLYNVIIGNSPSNLSRGHYIKMRKQDFKRIGSWPDIVQLPSARALVKVKTAAFQSPDP